MWTPPCGQAGLTRICDSSACRVCPAARPATIYPFAAIGMALLALPEVVAAGWSGTGRLAHWRLFPGQRGPAAPAQALAQLEARGVDMTPMAPPTPINRPWALR